MQSVQVCPGCGRTVNREYLYCPWCGVERSGGRGLESLDRVFRKLEALQCRDRLKYIDRLEAELADLERELDRLALGAELHT